jgi:hypothetical protein
MKITIEHYGERYSAEMPEECSLWDFHMALRAIVRCVWLEEQTAEIFNEEQPTERGEVHGFRDYGTLPAIGHDETVPDAQGAKGRRKGKRTKA